MMRITHYTFRPPSPGHSADNTVEMSQSAITDAAASALPREGEIRGVFANITLADLKADKIDASVLTDREQQAIVESSWEGVKRLAETCNFAPCMGSYLTALPAERDRCPLFCDDDHLRAYTKAIVAKRQSMPGGLHFNNMESILRGHSVIGHEQHFLEFLCDGCTRNPAYECSIASHKAGIYCRTGQTWPIRVQLPVPRATFGPDQLPSASWEKYRSDQDLPPNSIVLYGQDKHINKFNPQFNADQCFAENSTTFYEHWWDCTAGGVPPGELQFQPPLPPSASLAMPL
jgi:hypothetical protein